MQLPPAAPTPYDTTLAASADTARSPIATLGAQQGLPEKPPQGIETVMLAQDKLPVVLAVVLLIWFGLLLLLFRTDRHISRLERELRRDKS